MAIGGIIRFGYSKTYITEAGNWVSTTLPSNARIFSNSAQLMYYASDHFKTESRFTVTGPTETFGNAINSFCEYNYLMIRVNQADTLSQIEQKFIQSHSTLKVFSNNRHDRVLIYQHKDFCPHPSDA